MKLQHYHPLDPLSATEVVATSDLLKAAFKNKYPAANLDALIFNVVTLKEPEKKALLAYETKEGAPLPARKGFAILQPPKSIYGENEPYAVIEAVANLDTKEVEEWNFVPGVQPLLTPEDCFEAERICKADSKVCEMLASRYGITDVDADVACDPWSVHEHGSMTGRLVQLFLYKRTSPNDNHYAHPIDMVPIADLEKGEIVHIDASAVPQPINEVNNNYHRDLMDELGGFRADAPKPLNIVQPEGPSFKVEGNKVTWQKWSFRVGFNYREGLVLHQVGYEDQGRVRPIIHRGSLVEMAVPYAEPRAPYNRKCAFDVGDYGLGNCSVSLALGCDCLGHIHYFDAVLNDRKGQPTIIKKAICMHEEDYGLLWKHVDYRTGHSESRRSRRLVISFLCVVVNYEYLFYYHFYQDGSIECDIKLTGQLSTNSLSPGEETPEYGVLVDPLVNAQHHQHMFCARFDMAVDDPEGGAGGLEVVEQEVEALPFDPETNPFGNAFKVKELVLEDEQQAQRVTSARTARTWVVKNPKVKNRLGQSVGYKIIVPENPLILAYPQGLIAKKGEFATKNLWVTPYDEKERWPAGDYVTQQEGGGQGLPAWTKKNRKVKGADVVLWPAYGLTHIPRVEDFGTMPVEIVSIKLKPSGFFDRNPAQDLPPECNKASKENEGAGGKASCCGGGGEENPSPN